MYSTFSYIEAPDTASDRSGEGIKAFATDDYELLPGENIRYDGTLICRYRGNYRIGIKHITIVDFFRLFKVTYRVPEPVDATVIPRIIRLNGLKSVPELSVSSFKENPHLNTDFDAALREYIPGDPVRGIHWKQSARTGKLQSRLTYEEQKHGIGIFLDTFRSSEDEYEYIPLENKCLEIILALTQYFTTFSIPCDLLYSQDAPLKLSCSAPGEMEAFLSSVSTIRFRSSENISGALEAFTLNGALTNCMLVFLIITNPDKEVCKKLYELSILGIKAIIYYVSTAPVHDELSGLQNIRVIHIHPEDELKDTI